ncbi:MAG: TetR family transcriptional regulator C-terminal domain-containing protein [Lysobacterales bacterium]|jgi:AcrR family transcriptional regulator
MGIPSSDTGRRAAIFAAAKALIRERGLSEVRTRDVTERAGVGIGLLNHYFRWQALRAEAAVAALEEEIERVFPIAAAPGAVLTGFVKQAFTERSAPLWRLWIETTDAALTDEEMSKALASCAVGLLERVASTLDAGSRLELWSCPNPRASAMRILALHDGLAGFVLTGIPPISRAEATAHLKAQVNQECGRNVVA